MLLRSYGTDTLSQTAACEFFILHRGQHASGRWMSKPAGGAMLPCDVHQLLAGPGLRIRGIGAVVVLDRIL